jgi:hypothetical protein
VERETIRTKAKRGMRDICFHGDALLQRNHSTPSTYSTTCQELSGLKAVMALTASAVLAPKSL